MFNGIHAVLYALFNADETLDPGAMRAQVAHVTAAGCHGITVLGLATEVAKLTFAERLAVIETVGAANGGRLPFSVTIAGNSVAEQQELARRAVAHGADWLILQPPMVGSYGAGVYIDFMARVAGAVSCPVAVQNAPQYLGRSLSPADIAQLAARCPNFAAIKAFATFIGTKALAVVKDFFNALAGNDDKVQNKSIIAFRDGVIEFAAAVKTVAFDVVIPAFNAILKIFDGVAAGINKVFGT